MALGGFRQHPASLLTTEGMLCLLLWGLLSPCLSPSAQGPSVAPSALRTPSRALCTQQTLTVTLHPSNYHICRLLRLSVFLPMYLPIHLLPTSHLHVSLSSSNHLSSTSPIRPSTIHLFIYHLSPVHVYMIYIPIVYLFIISLFIYHLSIHPSIIYSPIPPSIMYFLSSISIIYLSLIYASIISILLSIFLSSTCSSIYLSIYIPKYPPIKLSIYLCIYDLSIIYMYLSHLVIIYIHHHVSIYVPIYLLVT